MSRGAGKAPAGGWEAIRQSVLHMIRETGVVNGTRTLLKVNRPGGFDCPGCAWPEPRDPSPGEFCENGAKHIAHEATTKRVTPDFFADWPIPGLLGQSDEWLEKQGRLTHPMVKPRHADRYEPISWDGAFAKIAAALRELGSPDQAVFYTSGRTSNEAAFLYQLFVRQFGTNNLPDCSNLCHESSGTGMSTVVGVVKGTVSLEDFERCDAIFILGQNPGTNHPRMLTELLKARRRGCRIVSINPLRERGLESFIHPKELHNLLRGGTEISDLYLQVRVGGDIPLLKGIMKELLAIDETGESALDHEFLERHAVGFEAFRTALGEFSFDDLVAASGISRADMRRAAEIYAAAGAVIACWAMGLTQHRHGVGNVREVTNLMLLGGNLGRPGAGLCPVRGHSNVQGDRTMGIWEKPRPAFLDALSREFTFEPPREHGYDTVAALEAMKQGKVGVFFALGGNFAVATPDPDTTAAALRRCRLTVQVSTKLNRSHLVVGGEAILLPCLGRTELDRQVCGEQFVTVEDSMSMVHASRGQLSPASSELRSEPAIVAGLARATLGDRSTVPWEDLVADYDRIRDRIERVIPGFEDFNRRVREPGGFLLPNAARERCFETASGKAELTVQPLPDLSLEPDELWLTTIRSHDQFNTTVYSQNDRYRGIYGDRRVVLMNVDDISGRGLRAGQKVDLRSRAAGETRCIRGFRIVEYDVPRGTAAAYFPEANGLVPTASVAEESRTPTYKSIRIVVKPQTEDE